MKIIYFCMTAIFSTTLAVDVSAEESKENGEPKPFRRTDSPGAFIESFKLKQLNRLSEKEDDALFILQVGTLDASGMGSIIRYDGAKKRILLRTISANSAAPVDVEYTVHDSDLEKDIASLIKSAPTKPIDPIEAALYINVADGRAWVFEYADPLGGIISMVMMDSKSTGTTDRRLDEFTTNYDNLMKKALKLATPK